MVWIESHQELGGHPKTKKLARLLGVSIPAAVGHLQFLWWWALDYAEDGDLTKYDPEDIAMAAMWEGDPDQLISALIDCGPSGHKGFLENEDGQLLIHDWYEYAGRLLDKRRQNTERKRKSRARHVPVTHDTHGSHGATKPNHTQPNITKPDDDNNAHAHELQPADLVASWEQETGRPVSPVEAQKIIAYVTEDDLPAEVIQEAMSRAVIHGQPILAYVDGILKKWIAAKVKSLADIERIDAQFNQRKKSRPTARSPGANPGPEYEDLSQRWREGGARPDG